MCKSSSTDNAETINEINNSSGFHLLELHLPSVSFSIGFTIIVIGIIALMYYCCRRRRQNNHHQNSTIAPQFNPYLQPAIPLQDLWNQQSYIPFTPRPRINYYQEVHPRPAFVHNREQRNDDRIREVPNDADNIAQ